MLTTEECPGMNVGTGKFSDDVEMTVCRGTLYYITLSFVVFYSYYRIVTCILL